MQAALANSCKFHFLNSQQRNFSLLLVCSMHGLFFLYLKVLHVHGAIPFSLLYQIFVIDCNKQENFIISSYDMIFLGHSSFHHLYIRDFGYCLLDYFLINNACSFTIINYYLKSLILQIAPDWRQALTLKKTIEDKIAKGKDWNIHRHVF